MSLARSRGFRLFSLAVLVGGGLYLGVRHESSRASAVIELGAGASAERVRALEVELRRRSDGEVVGSFRAPSTRGQPGGGLGRWPLTVSSGSYDLVISIDADDGRHLARRSIELSDGVVVHVDLAPDLVK